MPAAGAMVYGVKGDYSPILGKCRRKISLWKVAQICGNAAPLRYARAGGDATCLSCGNESAPPTRRGASKKNRGRQMHGAAALQF